MENSEILKSVIENTVANIKQKGGWLCTLKTQHMYENISDSQKFHVSPSEYLDMCDIVLKNQ